ncbi:transglycosylase family protein [Streptomyces sp. NPDC051940]|uniref:transglycosylase family protein n=1 Tax=Streptomyces sp. NPDC051940 TaxID=3155675 RepID=UPI00342B6448
MLPGNGRHRRPRQAPAIVVTVGVTGAGIALPLLAAASGAFALDAKGTDKVAQCESDALWSADSGDGYYGGLQLTPEQWNEYGGRDYADRPDHASRAQQIAVGEKILEDLGTEAFRECVDVGGLRQDAENPEIDPGRDYPDFERQDAEAKRAMAENAAAGNGGGKHRGNTDSDGKAGKSDQSGNGKHRGQSADEQDPMEVSGSVGDPSATPSADPVLPDAVSGVSPSQAAANAQGGRSNGQPSDNSSQNAADDDHGNPWDSVGALVDELPDTVPDTVHPGQSGKVGRM